MYNLLAKYNDQYVVGHYAEFTLISGFHKSDYMSHAEAMAHGEKFSKAYQNDLRKKEKKTPWSLYPIPQSNKTVYLRLMRRYGILSIEMQTAFEKDESFEAAQTAAEEQIKTGQGSKVVDAEFEKPEQDNSTPTTKEQLDKRICLKCKLPFRRKGMRKATKCCECEVNKETGEVAEPAPAENEEHFEWFCKNPKCKLKFNEPKVGGTPPNDFLMCPNLSCCSKNVEKVPF